MKTSGFANMLLTDELLLNFKRCQRRAYLNLYGNTDHKNYESEFLLKLRREMQVYLDDLLHNLTHEYEQPQGVSWFQKSQETLRMMRAGVNCIYQGVLAYREEDYDYVSYPDILLKQPGLSHFGDWYYLPITIKLGRRPKPEYKIVVTFHGWILQRLQDHPSKEGWLLLRDEKVIVYYSLWWHKLQEVMDYCLGLINDPYEPEVFISRQKCSLCSWYNFCYQTAQSFAHLSLIPGITPSRYEGLKSLGIVTREQLIKADLKTIAEAMIVDISLAKEIKLQTESLENKQPYLRKELSQNLEELIPTKSVEFYFDIEAESSLNVDYLLGIVKVDRIANQEYFYGFLAEKPEQEKEIWHNFLAFVNSYPQAPIFHFSDYEVDTVKRLGNLYKTPKSVINQLLKRFVDLHQRVTNYAILPIENYSLKSIGNYLGFFWRDKGANGEQCVCWYDQWLETFDRTYLQAILRYNEDDCRATYRLKEWLVNFLYYQ